MKNKICFFVSENLLKETKIILEQEKLENFVVIKSYNDQYIHARRDFSPLMRQLSLCKDKFDNVFIFGGKCLEGLEKRVRDLPEIQIKKEESYAYFLLNRDILNKYIEKGSYLITPGWLAKWKTNLKYLGYNRQSGTKHFHKYKKKIQLLDTRIYPKSKNSLKRFANFLYMPFDSIDIGIDYYRLYILDIINNWRIEKYNDFYPKEISDKQKCMKNHEMIFDFLRKLPIFENEKNAVDSAVDLFKKILMPGKINYLSIKNKKILFLKNYSEDIEDQSDIKKRLYSYAENTGYINNNSGFYISVENGVRRLGLIEVDNIDNKECFEKFFNMAKIIMSILGVCISNIRQFEESKISRKEMDIFSYTASHDLKTPLANVKMGIDLARDIIKEGIDKENISEIIDMIEKSIKSGMEMLEKNLLIIRSSRKPEEIKSINVKKILESYIMESKVLIKDPNIHILLQDDLGCINAEENHIYFLFGNIINGLLNVRENMHKNTEYAIKINYKGKDDFGAHHYRIISNLSDVKESRIIKTLNEIFKNKRSDTGVVQNIITRITELYSGEFNIHYDNGIVANLFIRDFEREIT